MTQSTSEPPFERTRCACNGCVACCKRQPGALVLRDVERIIQHREEQGFDRELAFEWFKKHFWASPGALVKDVETGKVTRVGSITPRYRKGRCVFLNEQDRCSIHEVSPFGCAYYDTHMDWHRAHERSIWAVKSHLTPEYQELRKQLPIATHYKPNAF